MAIQDAFRRVLGREPRADEINFFKKFMDSGDLDEYEIGQILGATPEAQQALNTQQTGQYRDILAQTDEDTLGRAGDALTSQFRKAGRSPSSSGYVAAFADAARMLAVQRQQAVGQFAAGGLGNIQQAYAGQGAGAQERGYGQRDVKQNRAWGIEDYYRQKSDYDNYLNQQNRLNRQRAFGQLGGAVIGAGLGGAIGGFGGARTGAQIGSQFGGIFG